MILPGKGGDADAHDEGFETQSDPSASQRTSMSSTLESELTGTPTLGRKDYSKQKQEVTDDEKEDRPASNYFARSIDSLVQRQDLVLSEAPADESLRSFNDKTPTMEDNNRLEVWSGTTQSSDSDGKTVANTPEEEAEETEEVWTTVTVERKFSDMSPEEQKVNRKHCDLYFMKKYLGNMLRSTKFPSAFNFCHFKLFLGKMYIIL